MSQKELLKHLRSSGALKSPGLIRAFKEVDRADFVPCEYQELAYIDEPLPIGSGQTISQPSTVAFMMELLQPQVGQKVLDVGFGSGWTTALLARIVGDKGAVCGIELRDDVYKFGSSNLKRAGYKNMTLIRGSGQSGLPGEAPFGRILVSAAAKKASDELMSQLAVNGRMVVPLITRSGQSIVSFEKGEKGKLSRRDYPGFVFVPFITD